MNRPNHYPTPHKVQQQDNYHGIIIEDPYRWLEAPDSEQTQAWIEEENQITSQFLSEIPQRESLKQRITELWNYEKYSLPFKQGNRYFYYKNDGLQNQSVLYTQNSLEDEPRELLDPNKLSADGTIALSGIAISEDGNLLAYGLSQAGSDWQEWKVKNIETGQDLSDHLQWIKFSGATWTHDHQGFFYSRYDEPNANSKLEETNYFQKLYYHQIGTPQTDDILIYHRPDQKEWGFESIVSEDGQYLIICVWQGTETKNLIFYQDLTDKNSQVIELLNQFEASYYFIENEGTKFWFRTDLNAPKGKIISIDISNQDKKNWQEIIPEAEEVIESISILNNQFIINYLKDAKTQIKIFNLDGSFVREIDLPGIGSAGGFLGKRYDRETFYTFTSFTTPNTIYRYDLTTGKSTLFRQPQVKFDPQQYQTSQIFYPSKDGTKIPLFITHKKDLNIDGNNPTYLYGYGGFGVSLTPWFSVGQLVWMELGGILAVANLRGGGEYGEQWHQAGMKHKKQNVFDDFISAGEWLIANQYTNSKKLAIGGGSNGGLLVGACMNQRPELFAAAIPEVGVMDMLRFDKFTIGWAWCPEYGSPENPEDFKILYSYSPLHNIKPDTPYPATLVITADHDDRVVPAHSFKFVATLQEKYTHSQPILIRIETKAGHGAGKPTTKIIEEIADRWAFLVRVLEIF